MSTWFMHLSFPLAFYGYLAGTILAIGATALAARSRWVFRLAYAAMAAGAVGHSAVIADRWIAGGHAPLSGLFDAVVFFAWTTVVAFAVAEALFRTRWLTMFVGAIAVVMLAYAAICDARIQPPMPVLKSAWLTIHVVAYMVAYGVMALGCFSAVSYYIHYYRRDDAEALQKFDQLTYRLVAFGFPLLTAGILTGAVWADQTWGGYWRWDPKETWSLITWIVYAVFLHLRLRARHWEIEPRERRGAFLNWLAILGFAAIIFTFLLLNLLPSPSIHSYM